MTGLHLAAYFGVEEAAKALYKKGVETDAKKRYGRTPLSLAAENGRESVVRLLLAEDDVDVNSKDNKRRTPLIVGCTERDNDRRTPLLWAARYGYEAAAKQLLEKAADLESKDKEYGQTPLSWAAIYRYEAVVKQLLEKGGRLETRDRENCWTPLSWAAKKGYEMVIKALLEKGADLEAEDNERWTPLLWAARNGHKGVVELLQLRKLLAANAPRRDVSRNIDQ